MAFNGPAADNAVFDVVLIAGRTVDQRGKGLAAIRASNGEFFNHKKAQADR